MGFEPTEAQALAIRTLGSPLTISAGAGSGKTRVLAERFVAAVDPRAPVAGWEPAPIGGVLTVTFTDKAAGELAERVRRVLLEHGLTDEARRVDEAWISTIHGLCARLLRLHALEARLDPAFGVISQVDAGTLRDEVLERLLRDELASGAAGDLVGTFGVAQVRDLILELHDRVRAMGCDTGGITVEPAPDPGETVARARSAIGRWRTVLAGHPAPGRTLLTNISRLAAAEQAMEALAAPPPADEDAMRVRMRGVLSVLHALKLSRSVGSAKDLVDEVLDERALLLDEAVRAVTAPLERDLVALTATFGEQYAGAKAQRSRLDFDDLQLLAVRLLEGSQRLAEEYRELFRLVMIDEFQDTNEVQTALIDLLSDGTACTVGDERQSIYGFRYADVGVYRAHRERMLAEGAACAELTHNFRSHPQVLAFVNGLFARERLFGPDFLRLEHGRVESPPAPGLPYEGPRAELIAVQCGRRTSAARPLEADAIAARLRGLVDDGVSPGDIVVLLRAMTHVGTYDAALRRHGLETAIVSGGSFFDRPEVEAVRAVLRAAANPLDDEAVAAVLASGIGRLSDDALMRLRGAAGGGALWDALGTVAVDGDDARALERVRTTIGHARARQGRSGVAEIIHRACEESDFDLVLLSGGAEGRRAYANVLKLARLAQQGEQDGRHGIRRFLEHLDLKERYRDREAPATVADERGDAVRIMTVHGAKGLEFPVVAVPELGSRGDADRGALVIEKEGTGARIALGLPKRASDGATDERRSRWASAALERTTAAKREEDARVFYVACTRARELLVLSGTGDLEKGCGDTPLGWVLEAATADPDLPLAMRRLDEDEPLSEPAPGSRERSDAASAPAARAAAPVKVRTADAATAPWPSTTPPAISYSAIALYGACPRRYAAERVLRVGVAEPLASGPLAFGDAVHAALRLAVTGGAVPERRRLAAILRSRGCAEDELARLERAVAGLRRSVAWERAVALGGISAEVPFAVPLDGATLVGRLDFVARHGEEALVIDYKTGHDALAPDSGDEHHAQADCYALAMLSAGVASVTVTFVGVETGDDGRPRERSHRYEHADLPRLREWADAAAARLANGPWDPPSPPRAGSCAQCPVPAGVCDRPRSRRGQGRSSAPEAR